MSFTEKFPERSVQPPQIPGQPVFQQSGLTSLRRQQLADLAVAYDIPVNISGTKPELLAVLVEAEQAGVFRTPPKRPEYLVKAQRNPDEPPVDWEAHRAPDLDVNNFHHLQRVAKEYGVNSFGKGRDALLAELKEKGVL